MLSQVSECSIKVSRPAEQAAIAVVLFDKGSEIATLEAKLGEARPLKQG